MAELCFSLPDTAFVDDANRGEEYYRERILTLSQRCSEHYENKQRHAPGSRSTLRAGRSSAKDTLYTGALGPCCYLRYRIATSPTFSGDTAAKFEMLMDAFSSANTVLIDERRSREESYVSHQVVTLLNGDLVGALTMKIVIGDKALRLLSTENFRASNMDAHTLKKEIEDSMRHLQEIADTYILSSCLPSSECELMNGRSGYLKAIKFIQSELSDSNFGKGVVRKVLAQILEEGYNVGGGALLLWKWKQKAHLGALHGISGIMHTLLDFEEDLASIDQNAWSNIEATVMKMNDYCLKSGNLAHNLKSTLPNAHPKKWDKLVQFCSGAPGHVLILLQMYRKSQDQDYLLQAMHIADSVVLPRGLLRKGVGLCHGISGNGFIFLSICRALAVSNPGSSNDDASSEEDSQHWLQCAYMYANFALDHLEELESIPDQPYSLYEGVAGLVCLLLGLVEGTDGENSQFPCFEF